jgi:ferredoxin
LVLGETKVTDSPILLPYLFSVTEKEAPAEQKQRMTMDAALSLPRIDHDTCTGCADCVDVCHVNALAIQKMKAVMVRAGDCDYCTDCEAVCPVLAIACPFEVVVAG